MERFHSRDQQPAAILDYWNKFKESICLKIEFKSLRISLVHHHGRHSFVLEHQHGRRDVMWKRSIGLIPKVIPLKLFLDMAPSSSEDVTRAMRGLPKRFSRNYLRIWWKVFYMFWFSKDASVFCTLSCLFVRLGLRLLCSLWLFIILPFIRF